MNREPNPGLEALLASLEPPYRSRGEAQVGRLLDRHGIPFFYRQPTFVLDGHEHRTVHPTFTLPDYADVVIDYAAPPDQQ